MFVLDSVAVNSDVDLIQLHVHVEAERLVCILILHVMRTQLQLASKCASVTLLMSHVAQRL